MRCLNLNINIMTWNTQLYEYGNKIGGKTKIIDNSAFDAIIKIIDQHLNKENAIVVLQEIPYKCNRTWAEHELFKKFKDHYGEDEYTVIYDIFSENQIKMTVVISKKGLIESKQCEKNNCYVSFKIKNTDIRALAVQAHNAFECREFISRNYGEQYNMMLGDFNAGNYIKKLDDTEIVINRQNYLLMLEGYIDICQGEYTTIYKTYIDHVLLESSYDFISSHRYNNVNIDRNITLSDHYPITFELLVLTTE